MTPFFDRRVADWVAQRIPGCERGWESCHALGVEHDEQIVGGIVFHNWVPEHGVIELSAAGTDPRWLNRNVFNMALRYVFDDLNCQMATAQQDPENKRAIRIWKALGAQEFIIPRLRGRNNAGSIVTLTDDAWARSKFKR